jgi:hypothetical protein
MGIFDVFSAGPQEDAARARQAAAEKGYQQYTDLAQQGRGALTTNYTAALQPYQEMQGTDRLGLQAYADASGANGPEGLARAQSTYSQSRPGFAFAAEDAAKNIARAGVAGGAPTGNTMQAITDRIYGLGQTDYRQYMQGLLPFLGQSQQTAAGIGGLYGQLGQGLAGSFGNQGQAAIGTQDVIGKAQSDAALAPYTASANLWGAGLNALGSIAKIVG